MKNSVFLPLFGIKLKIKKKKKKSVLVPSPKLQIVKNSYYN